MLVDLSKIFVCKCVKVDFVEIICVLVVFMSEICLFVCECVGGMGEIVGGMLVKIVC